MKKVKQISDSILLGIILAVVGGFLDAYTYLIRGGVFANAQTGNIVLLGVNLAQSNYSEAVHYLVPILAFAFGILTVELIKSELKSNVSVHWRQIIVIIELILLFACSFIDSGVGNALVNTVISFVCALQVESFRAVEGNAAATTMCTGNLRSGTEQLFLAMKFKDKQHLKKGIVYYVIIAAFVFGAVMGALIINYLGIKAILVACALLLLSFFLMFE